ncbi:MAG TPA: hypothetical protein VLG49_02995 [Rhabdochlamydiaceae bacterium]|nr:hypothetical protein [Rhabdochlamydiaceae bacterium]
MKKSVRLARNDPATLAHSVVLPAPVIAQQMARPPLSSAEKDKGFIRAAEEMESKKFHKVSKRTTPGEVPSQSSAPHIVHVEGQRWIKTIEKQITAENKIFTKQSSKKKLPTRKKGVPFK